RRSEFLPDVARDFIETDADVFWAQQGLENQEAEQILRDHDRHQIVMDRCIKVEYAYSGLRQEKE
ncbi:MAG: CoA-binding protein, partial [Lactococcus sp.]|nr:CoA-binding protein [Lactococcus sp.]